jgi:hypothetical protein
MAESQYSADSASFFACVPVISVADLAPCLPAKRSGDRGASSVMVLGDVSPNWAYVGALDQPGCGVTRHVPDHRGDEVVRSDSPHARVPVAQSILSGPFPRPSIISSSIRN